MLPTFKPLHAILTSALLLQASLSVYAQGCTPEGGGCALMPPSEEYWSNPQPNPPNPNPPSGGDPVDLYTGMLLLREKDLSIAGRGMDVTFERSYASGYVGKTSMGPRHNFNWFQRLVVEYEWTPWPEEYHGPGDGYPFPYPPETENQEGQDHPEMFPRVVGAYHYDGGNRIEWYQIGPNPQGGLRWNSSPGVFAKLRDLGSSYPFSNASHFELRTADGTVYTFGFPDTYTPYNSGLCKTYWLTKIEDRNGNRIQLLYGTAGAGTQTYHRVTSVVDPLGRELTITYEPGTGWVQSVTDFTGRTVTYERDAEGNLTGIVSPPVPGFPNGRRKLYGYALPASHDLTSIVDAREVANGTLTPYLVNEYDAGHRVTQQLFGDGVAAGGWYRFLYELQSSGFNAQRTLLIDANGNVSLTHFLPGGSDDITWNFTGRARPDQIPAGTLIDDLVSLDPAGPNASADALRTTAPGYEAPLRASDPPCFVTTKQFDSNGLITGLQEPGINVEYLYDSGSLDTFQRGNQLKVTRHPVPAGTAEPLVEVFAYEPYFNQLRASIDPRGNSSTYQAPNGGGPGPDPDRYRSLRVFDYEEGTLAALQSLTVAWGIDTTQATMFAALGTELGSLGPITPNNGVDLNGDSLTDQAHGNVILDKKPDARVYEPSVLSGSFLPQSVQTAYRYNVFGQVKAIVDPEHATRFLAYHSAADPDGDGVPTPQPPTGLVLDTTSGPDGGGYLKEEVLPGAIKRTRRLDPLGRVTETTNGRGFTSKTAYDALDQVTRETDALQNITYFSYDGNANLTERRRTSSRPEIDPGTRVPTGATVYLPDIVDTFQYDILNQLTRQDVQADPADHAAHVRLVTEFRYDKLGNRALTILPEASAYRSLSNVESALFDERNLPFQTAQGGWPAGFESRFANGNIPELGAGGPFVSSADLAIATRDYTPAGRIARLVDGEGKVHRTEYDALQRVVRGIDPLGNELLTAWDPAGNVTDLRFLDAAGTLLRHQRSHFDELNRAFESGEEILPAGSVVEGALSADGYVGSRTRFDRRGATLQIADDTGAVTTYSFDGLGRNVTRSDALGNTLAFVHDHNSNVIKVTETERVDATGQLKTFVTRHFFDALDRCTASTDNLLQTQRKAYDSRGNLVFQSDTRSATTGVNLSSLDSFSEHSGLAGLTTNGHGNTSAFEFDDAGRRTASHRDLRLGGAGELPIDTTAAGDGRVTVRASFDSNGRLVGEADDAGNWSTHAYDALNRRVSTTFADGTIETRQFDRRHLPTRIVHANRYVEILVYDDAGRLTNKAITKTAGPLYGSTFEVYQYDGLGRIVSAQDDDSTVTRTYDVLHGVRSEQQAGLPATVRLHDGLGHPRSVTYPGGTIVTLGHDAIGRLDSVQVGSDVIADYSHVGWRVETRFNPTTGQKMTVIFDNLRRPTEIRHSGLGGVGLGRWRSTWDAANNKTSRTYAFMNVDQVRHEYEYDSLDRMVLSERTAFFDPSLDRVTDYALDGVNNRLAVAGQPYLSSAALPEPADWQMNQYTATPAGNRTYDKSGNLTSSGGATMRYDYRNHLVEHTLGGVTTTYRYDCFGRRIEKSVGGVTVKYVYSGPALLEERDTTNTVVATFVHGRSADDVLRMDRWNGAAWQTSYLLSDDLSNVVKVVDSASATLETYEFDDYGAPLAMPTLLPLGASVLGNTRLFSGREYDSESGLYFFRARYLDPVAGRFTTRDPIGLFGDAANSGNGTTYVGDNPWSYRDPTGLQKGAGCPGMIGPDPGFLAVLQEGIRRFNALLERLAGDASARGDQATAQGLSALGSAIGVASSQLAPIPAQSPLPIDCTKVEPDINDVLRDLRERLGRPLTAMEICDALGLENGIDAMNPKAPHTPTFSELMGEMAKETPAQRDARIREMLKGPQSSFESAEKSSPFPAFDPNAKPIPLLFALSEILRQAVKGKEKDIEDAGGCLGDPDGPKQLLPAIKQCERDGLKALERQRQFERSNWRSNAQYRANQHFFQNAPRAR